MKARALSAITEFRKADHLIYLQVRTLWSETVWAPVPLTSWTTLSQLLNSSALSFLTHKMGVIVTVIGYSFARACITACHKHEWLRQHEFIVSELWRLEKPKIKVSTGLVSSGGCGGRLYSRISLWLTDNCLLPVSLHGVFLCVCLSLFKCLLSIRILHWVSAHSNDFVVTW